MSPLEMEYRYVELPTGEQVVLFVNPNTRLIVVDVIAPDESGGVEFVRCTIPDTSWVSA